MDGIHILAFLPSPEIYMYKRYTQNNKDSVHIGFFLPCLCWNHYYNSGYEVNAAGISVPLSKLNPRQTNHEFFTQVAQPTLCYYGVIFAFFSPGQELSQVYLTLFSYLVIIIRTWLLSLRPAHHFWLHWSVTL